MDSKRTRLELSAAAIAITAAAAVTAAAAAATGIVLHKLAKLRTIFDEVDTQSPVSFEEEPEALEVAQEEKEETK